MLNLQPFLCTLLPTKAIKLILYLVVIVLTTFRHQVGLSLIYSCENENFKHGVFLHDNFREYKF